MEQDPMPHPIAQPRHGVRAAARSLARRFAADVQGATAIEYGLMAAIFSVTVIGGSSSIRSALQAAFSTVTTAIASAQNI
jgi:pilus assembly protein Flp/PilA